MVPPGRDATAGSEEAEQRVALEQLQASHEHQAFLLQAAEIVSQADGYGETLRAIGGGGRPHPGRPVPGRHPHVGRPDRPDGGQARRSSRSTAGRRARDRSTRPTPPGTIPASRSCRPAGCGGPQRCPTSSSAQTTRDERHFALLKRLGFTSYMVLPAGRRQPHPGLDHPRFGRVGAPLRASTTSPWPTTSPRVWPKWWPRPIATMRLVTPRRPCRRASYLTTCPTSPGLAIAVRYLPATLDNDVGGDFYDVIPSAVGHGDHRDRRRRRPRHAGGGRHGQGPDRGPGPGQSGHRAPAFHGDAPPRVGRSRARAHRHPSHRQCRSPARGGSGSCPAGHPPPLLVTTEGAQFFDVTADHASGRARLSDPRMARTLAEGAALLLYTDGLIEDRQSQLRRRCSQLSEAHGRPGEARRALRPGAGRHGGSTSSITTTTSHWSPWLARTGRLLDHRRSPRRRRGRTQVGKGARTSLPWPVRPASVLGACHALHAIGISDLVCGRPRARGREHRRRGPIAGLVGQT